MPEEWPHMRSTAKWVLPVLVGPSTGLERGGHAIKIVRRPPKRKFFGHLAPALRSSGHHFASPQCGGLGRIRNLTLTCFLHNRSGLPSGCTAAIFRRARGGKALYQVNEINGGAASGSGQLALDFATWRGGAAAARPGFGQKAAGGHFGEFELVVDLGQRIGSRDWFRGLITCAGLCYAAWSLAPGLAPLPGASPAPYPEAQFAESRALVIAPAAYGGDTGKRMAPTDAVEPLAESPERPVVDLRATLGRGDGFAGLLERAGVAAVEADRVADLVGEVVPASAVRPGTVMDITLGRRPNRMVARPLEKLAFRARFDLRIELARAGGTLHVNQIPIAVDDTPLRIQGRVGDSLYRSARAAGAPAQAVEAYLRALNGQISVPAGIASDDRFDIIIEHRRAATGEVESGDLLYAGLNRSSGHTLQMMQWTIDAAPNGSRLRASAARPAA